MGTNYYVYIPNEDVSKDAEKLHIGKSSMGWVFSLRIYPERGINTLYDWLPILLNSQNAISNEYGTHITAADLLERITCRSRLQPVDWSEREWELNHAEPGPNNLARGKSRDGRRHGEGTWDYCNYEFF